MTLENLLNVIKIVTFVGSTVILIFSSILAIELGLSFGRLIEEAGYIDQLKEHQNEQLGYTTAEK